MPVMDRTWGKYQPITDDRKARVVHYLKHSELSYQEIAERTGLSKGSVSAINEETGARKPKRTEEVE